MLEVDSIGKKYQIDGKQILTLLFQNPIFRYLEIEILENSGFGVPPDFPCQNENQLFSLRETSQSKLLRAPTTSRK